MSQFEKYHPILTPHYAFDWLTKVRVVDVFNLYQTTDTTVTMAATADRINQVMREIFNDRQLIWGVTDRTTNDFCGQVGFAPIDMAAHQATLTVQLTDANHDVAPLTKILERLVAFGTVELKLQQLKLALSQPDSLMGQVLTTLGFTTTDNLNFDYQAS